MTAARPLVTALALALAAGATAGPLNPPAGPVAPSMRRLDQLEPRRPLTAAEMPGDADSVIRITQPGSYYLTDNLSVPANFSGIEIVASDVSIDLNGFQVVAAAPGTRQGIVSYDSLSGVRIGNGSVRGFGGAGIALPYTNNVQIEAVSAAQNGDSGIEVGTAAVIARVVASENGRYGIATGGWSTVSDCTVGVNADTGIQTGLGSVVARSTARQNGGFGIRCDGSGVVSDCTAHENGVSGFYGSNTYSNCRARANQSDGFFGGYVNASFTNCHADANLGDGFDAGDQAIVTGCTARENRNHGIRARHAGQILNNVVWGNGPDANNGSGIYVDGNGSRIEANTAGANDYGVHVVNAGNLVVRNTARANRVGAFRNDGGANSFGPALALNALATSTNPHANFALD